MVKEIKEGVWEGVGRMKKNIIVEYDDREPNYQLDSDLNVLNMTFNKVRLKIGDYVYKNVIVERKTIDDLCASIVDKRIEIQVEKMKKSGKECYIFIVGHLKDKKSELNENCVLGKVISLLFKHDMKIMWCEDEIQFLWCLRNLFDKYDEKYQIITKADMILKGQIPVEEAK